MGARISKFPPIAGTSFDLHDVDPPSVPPPPPAPPNPAKIPTYGWIVVIAHPAAGIGLTGKWAWQSVTTEFMGDILHGHDWGPGQVHIPIPPVVATPSLALLVLGSSTKYWMPAFSVKEKTDGTFPGGEKPIAVSTPAFFIPTQNCQKVFPSLAGVCFQLVSSRWCAFTWGDLVAGAMGVVTDAVTGAISGAFGSMIPGDSVQRQVANAVLGHAVGAAVNAMDAWGPEGAPLGGFGKSMRAVAGVFALGWGNTDVAANLLTPFVGDVVEVGSNAVGDHAAVTPPSGAGTGS